MLAPRASLLSNNFLTKKILPFVTWLILPSVSHLLNMFLRVVAVWLVVRRSMERFRSVRGFESPTVALVSDLNSSMATPDNPPGSGQTITT